MCQQSIDEYHRTYFAKRGAASVPSPESTVCLFCSFKDLILESGAQECKWDESSKLSLNPAHLPSLILKNGKHGLCEDMPPCCLDCYYNKVIFLATRLGPMLDEGL